MGSQKKGSKPGKYERRGGNSSKPKYPRNDSKRMECEEPRLNPAETNNDATWYAENVSMLNNAATFSYYTRVGQEFTLAGSLSCDIISHQPYGSIGGVCALRIHPAVGLSTERNSAVNVAAFKLNSFVRHLNSGAKNYEAPDLMMYVLATAELYSAYTFLARTYGIMHVYSQENMYMPRALVEASGIDWNDVQGNLANYRYWLDVWAAKINSMAVPNNMSYFKRRMWTFANIYTDGVSAKAQLYEYVPDGFWQFEGYTNTKGGQLVYKPWFTTTTLKKLSDIITYMNGLIDVIAADEDMQTMSGDIKKAYGANLMALGNLPADFTIKPVYNEEVLSQINNTVILNRPTGTSSNVTQDIDQDRIIKFNPSFEHTANMWCARKFLNMYKDQPTPADNMVATRMMVICRDSVPSETGVITSTADSLGSDFCVSADIWTICKGVCSQIGRLSQGESLEGGTFDDVIEAVLCYFNRHFQTYKGPVDQATEKVSVVPYVYDLDNYIILDAPQLKSLHDCAVLSEFNVPGAAASAFKG